MLGGVFQSGTNLESVTTCELCKKKLHLSIDDFDVEELYRTYVQVSHHFNVVVVVVFSRYLLIRLDCSFHRLIVS